MNKDINVMIQLQKIWNRVLAGKEDIQRSEKSIDFWNDSIIKKNGEVEKLNKHVVSLKKTIKENETGLEELETKYNKIDERLKLLKSERELEAQKAELKKIMNERDSCEESLIILMDELDENERELNQLKIDLEESTKQAETDIAGLKIKIEKDETAVEENRKEFDTLIEDLSPPYRTRFLKLIQSKNGRGIGEVTGDICGSCNFQVPASLAADSASNEKVVSCTNCGRFIYRINPHES